MGYIKKLIATSAAGAGGALLLALPASALVNTSDIAGGAVTTTKIANGAVTTVKLRDNSVNTQKLRDASVTTAKLANGAVTGSKIASDTNIGLSATRVTTDTHSFQTIGADLNYEGNAGGTSTYHAGVMGNFLGDTLTNITSSYHAGVIGSYNVTTSDASTGAKAGVIGEVGDMSVANAAIMAVLGGDGGALTPDAAYGVQYFNSTGGSHFNYGLDLFHAATTDYTGASAVDYGTADIRLQNGETISNGTDGTIAFGAANLTNSGSVTSTGAVNFSGATALRAPIGSNDLTDGADASSTCAAGNKADIQMDTGNSLFVCDGTNWQQLD